MRKARWIPPLKYVEKLKQFRGLCKNRILLVRFIIFQTLFEKEFSSLLVRGGNAEFHCLRW